MMREQRKSGVRLTVFLILLLAATSMVAAFSVNPMTVALTPSGSGTVASFRIENDGNDPIALVISVVTRSVDPNGVEQNEPVGSDFLILPSRVVLEPRTTRVVKVQWRGSPLIEVEGAYRVVVEQVPVAFSESNISGIRIMFRYLASLYVVPAAAQADLELGSLNPMVQDGQAGFVVQLRNTGNKHAIIKTAKLLVRSGDREFMLPAESLAGLIGMNILAGSSRDVFLPWASASIGTAYEGVFTAEHD